MSDERPVRCDDVYRATNAKFRCDKVTDHQGEHASVGTWNDDRVLTSDVNNTNKVCERCGK